MEHLIYATPSLDHSNLGHPIYVIPLVDRLSLRHPIYVTPLVSRLNLGHPVYVTPLIGRLSLGHPIYVRTARVYKCIHNMRAYYTDAECGKAKARTRQSDEREIRCSEGKVTAAADPGNEEFQPTFLFHRAPPHDCVPDFYDVCSVTKYT